MSAPQKPVVILIMSAAAGYGLSVEQLQEALLSRVFVLDAHLCCDKKFRSEKKYIEIISN